MRYGDALRWERVSDPDRGQQQEVADAILERIRELYEGAVPDR